ncbi:MAG: hypothetical protein CXZ00_14015 [Acidobacteria bacterium]|nr:MAG: hypothetical protein CXZ00_14015 [Acidobacteriota bacterium]
MKSKRKSSESGLALLLAIFTLLLLAAIGLAMLCAADLETKIAANYRDKQNSIYASLSGLQEARDRLIPSRCDTATGTACGDPIAIDYRDLGLPSASAANVIYIINPDTTIGETAASIKPWDPTNKYYDTDLCTSPYLSTHLCSGGVPPSGSAWYQVYDNSSTSAGEYHPVSGSTTFPRPLAHKWVRITLKADNMTTVAAQSTPVGSQMCWNGTYQVPVTGSPGYSTSCSSTGGIVLFNGSTTCTTCTYNPHIGTGYSNPVVTISGGGGSGATATAHVTPTSNGTVGTITVGNGGSSYTSAPTVTISGGGGSGATATATIQAPGAPVAGFSAVTQQSPVGCYSSSAPAVSLSGGGGSGATGTANLGSIGKIDTITLTNPGSGYTSNPTVTITDSGGGSGASIQAQTTKSTLGRVYVLTSLAVGKGGSRTLSQMEVATPPAYPVTLPGALVIDSPQPTVDFANSNNYVVSGVDANSCSEAAVPKKVSVGVIDNPNNPTNPTAVSEVTASIPKNRTDHYTGKGPSPDVENVYAALGNLTTVSGADGLATSIAANATYTYSSNPSSIVLGNPNATPPICPTTVVNGDLTLGPVTGCGVLLVTGNLTMLGDYYWYGPVFVIGSGGSFTGGGGGHGQIIGSLFVAQTKNADGTMRSTLGTPTISFDISGGGGNGIQYDHCWSDNMLAALDNPSKSTQPLKILSQHTIF